jgi:hypothetical protein
MPVDTEVRVPTQPRSVRGLIRAGEVQPPGLRRDPRAPHRIALISRLGVLRGLAARLLRGFGRVCWRHRAGLGLYLGCFGIYATLGVLLSLRYGSYAGDAQSRLANAYFVLFSRDPHLGAIGFVWNPLPSLSVMPLLLLKGIWPVLASRALAANLTSAAFMAGCVILVHGMLRDLRVRRGARVALSVGFALQPMILLYGANGMSEAIFLFFLLLACRRLAHWLARNSTWDLVLAGCALAFAYLARVEAISPAVVAAGAVTVVTVVRSSGDRRARLRRAALHGFLFAAPAAFAFAVWAVISWVIVGHPFEQLSSQYGTAAQLTAGGDVFALGRGGIAPPRYVALQLAGLAPLLPVAVVAATWTAFRRRDLRVLAPAAVFGGVVLFGVLAFLRGQTSGNMRYLIAAIPLMFLLSGCALLREAESAGGWRWARAGLSMAVALALALPSVGSSAMAIADPHVGREEHTLLGNAFESSWRDPGTTAGSGPKAAEAVSRYLDARRLPAGAVVLDPFDNGSVCTNLILLASHRPRQFVIPNDRDFKPILADPVTFGAQYMFVPAPGGRAGLNELNRTYHDLYASGAGIADLEKEFTGRGCPHFRLYRLRARSAGG